MLTVGIIVLGNHRGVKNLNGPFIGFNKAYKHCKSTKLLMWPLEGDS